MEHKPPTRLEMPTFFFGDLDAIQQEARKEGYRCAEQYRRNGSICLPLEHQEVPAGTIIIAHQGVDLLHEQPEWRLDAVIHLIDGLCKAMNYVDSFNLGERYEARALETAWGALYYSIAQVAPYDAASYAKRFLELLRHWEALDSVRYLFRSINAPLTLEELVLDACGWAATAWCPDVKGDLRQRLRAAAERMAHASKEDCIAAILRQVPHTLPFARSLKHPDVLADLDFWRERLASLDEQIFERVSAALPENLIERMTRWDRKLDVQ